MSLGTDRLESAVLEELSQKHVEIPSTASESLKEQSDSETVEAVAVDSVVVVNCDEMDDLVMANSPRDSAKIGHRQKMGGLTAVIDTELSDVVLGQSAESSFEEDGSERQSAADTSLWGTAAFVGSTVLEVADFLGEVFAEFFGMTESRYQHVIDAYHRRQRWEAEERRREDEARRQYLEEQSAEMDKWRQTESDRKSQVALTIGTANDDQKDSGQLEDCIEFPMPVDKEEDDAVVVVTPPRSEAVDTRSTD